MEYQFFQSVQNLKPSAIREYFLNDAADPEVISLSAGNPRQRRSRSGSLPRCQIF